MFEELTASAGHRLVAALDDIAAGHYPARPETRNLCTMCAFVAVCRHPGGAEKQTTGRRWHDVEPVSRRRLRAKCLIKCASTSTPLEAAQETPDARARRLAIDPLSNVALEASAGTGKTRVLVDRYVRPARGRRRAAQHPGDHLHAQGGRGNARSASCRRCASGTARAVSARRRGARSATRSATSASAPSTPSASRCCTSFRSRPASIPDSISPTKPRRRALSNRRSTARSRIGRAISIDDADVALLFTELGEPRLRKALTALLDRRLVARDALNRFLRGREMSRRRSLRPADPRAARRDVVDRCGLDAGVERRRWPSGVRRHRSRTCRASICWRGRCAS